MTTKTQRLINRIEEKESFYDIAYLCEDFDTFIDEISEWGVDHIGGVDFDDPEVNRGMMNAYFASFGCTPDNPQPAGRYASCLTSSLNPLSLIFQTQWEQSQSRSRNLLRITLWGYGGLMLKNVFPTNQY